MSAKDTGSPSEERTRSETPNPLAEALFGRPILPLDAYAFGRSFGRRASKLFPDKLLHVLRGLRSGIKEIRERQRAQEAGGQDR